MGPLILELLLKLLSDLQLSCRCMSIEKLRPPSHEIELDRLSQQFQRGITVSMACWRLPHWLRIEALAAQLAAPLVRCPFCVLTCYGFLNF